MPLTIEPLTREDTRILSHYKLMFDTVWPELTLTDEEFLHDVTVAGHSKQAIAFLGDKVVGAVMAERVTWNAPSAPPIAYAALLSGNTKDNHYYQLLEFAADFASEEGFNDLRVVCFEHEQTIVRLLSSLNGWQEVERNTILELDLSTLTKVPEAKLPEGFRATTLANEPHLLRSMYECASAALLDVPGDEPHQTPNFGDWVDERKHSLPDDAALLIAKDNEVLAYAQMFVTAARPHVARHDYTAVHPKARGLKLAYAVKTDAVKWAKNNGFKTIKTENEEKNKPIRRINTTLGYKPKTTQLYYRGPVSALNN